MDYAVVSLFSVRSKENNLTKAESFQMTPEHVNKKVNK